MWLSNGDEECLKRAIKYYSKGFQIRNDYYTGENYALCLDMMSDIEQDEDEKIYYTIAAKKARKKIIKILESVESSVAENNLAIELKWAYATLSNCYYGIANDVQGDKYEQLFKQFVEADWEAETFEKNKEKLFKLTRSK